MWLAFDRDAHHRAGGAVDAARQVDGDRPAQPMCSSPRSWRAAGPRPDGRDRRRTARRSRPPRRRSLRRGLLERPAPARGRLRRIALEPAALADEKQPARYGRARPGCAPPRSRRRHCCRGPPPPRTRPALQHRAGTSATARPAFSISAMPGVPPAMVSRSASAISAVVRSSIMAGRDYRAVRHRQVRAP